jgi:hypothetical protein
MAETMVWSENVRHDRLGGGHAWSAAGGRIGIARRLRPTCLCLCLIGGATNWQLGIPNKKNTVLMYYIWGPLLLRKEPREGRKMTCLIVGLFAVILGWDRKQTTIKFA